MVQILRASVAQSPISIPSISVHILPSKFHIENFRAALGQIFQTSLITTAPIGVQIFPNCVIWSKIIGSELPDKDLLIGFDLLALSKRL